MFFYSPSFRSPGKDRTHSLTQLARSASPPATPVKGVRFLKDSEISLRKDGSMARRVAQGAAVRRRGSLSEIFKTVRTKLQRDRSSTESSYGTIDSLFSESRDASSSCTEDRPSYQNGTGPSMFPTLELLPAFPSEIAGDTLCSALEKAGFGKFDSEEMGSTPSAQRLAASKPPLRASLFKLRWDRRSKSRTSEISVSAPKFSNRSGSSNTTGESFSPRAADLDCARVSTTGLQGANNQTSRVPLSFIDKVLEESITIRMPKVSKMKASGRRRRVEQCLHKSHQLSQLPELVTPETMMEMRHWPLPNTLSLSSFPEIGDGCGPHILSAPACTQVSGDSHARAPSTASEVPSCRAVINKAASALQAAVPDQAAAHDEPEAVMCNHTTRTDPLRAIDPVRRSATEHSPVLPVYGLDIDSDDQSGKANCDSPTEHSSRSPIMDACDGHYL